MPQTRAVEGDKLARQPFLSLWSVARRPRQRRRGQPLKEAVEFVVAGNAARRAREGMEPRNTDLAEVLHAVRALLTHSRPADGEGHRVAQFVFPGASYPRIGQAGKESKVARHCRD